MKHLVLDQSSLERRAINAFPRSAYLDSLTALKMKGLPRPEHFFIASQSMRSWYQPIKNAEEIKSRNNKR